MSLITPDFGLIFWMTLIFGALFFILAKFGFPMITGMVDKRAERIEDSLKKAEEAGKRLEEISAEQKALIDQARAEQGRILKEASVVRDEMIAKAREQASAEAATILENAKKQIEVERESALKDIRNEVARISMAVAEKVVRQELSDEQVGKTLMDKYLDEASQAQMTK